MAQAPTVTGTYHIEKAWIALWKWLTVDGANEPNDVAPKGTESS